MVPNVSTLHCYNKVYCSSKTQWIPINIIKSICIRHTHHYTPHSHVSIRHTPLHATLAYQHSAYTITRHTHISAFGIHIITRHTHISAFNIHIITRHTHLSAFSIHIITIYFTHFIHYNYFIWWKGIIEKVYRSYAQ